MELMLLCSLHLFFSPSPHPVLRSLGEGGYSSIPAVLCGHGTSTVNPYALRVMAEIGLRARTFSVSGLNISPLPHFYGIDLKNPLAF